MIVSEIMTKDLAVCMPNSTIKDCANLMLKNDCGEIPVVNTKDAKKLIGVITDRDITCRVVAQGVDPAQAQVKDFMTKCVYTIQKEDDLETCENLMSEHQVRRLPVVDENMCCIGLVSQAHIARHASKEKVGELAKELSMSRSAEHRTQNEKNTSS